MESIGWCPRLTAAMISSGSAVQVADLDKTIAVDLKACSCASSTSRAPWWRTAAVNNRGLHAFLGHPILDQRRCPMDWNRVEGNWKQLKGKIKEQWGELTDDDLDKIAGKRDQLEGKIQERYGLAKDQVRSDVDRWYERQTWQ
jgi:uncharacterized protein YjbJ (UPF0337 family)